MNIKNITEIERESLKRLLEEFSEKYLEAQVVSVCTSDGFDLCFVSKLNDTLEADKVSAISSTLCSLSNAASEQISNSALTITTIESVNGRNILLMKTTFCELECVICVEGTSKMSLAELRFVTNTLSEKVMNI